MAAMCWSKGTGERQRVQRVSEDKDTQHTTPSAPFGRPRTYPKMRSLHSRVGAFFSLRR
jgi:hypothetical protein